VVHHTIKDRLSNIASIKEWIKGKVAEDFTPQYRKALLRKVQINMGVTREKGREYIALVLGDED